MNRFRQRVAARNLAWVDDFLSPRACAVWLEELEFAFWRPSTVLTRYASGSLHHQYSSARVSQTTTEQWFSDELAREVRKIERRLFRLLGQPPERFEPWQVTRYGAGGQFGYHHDSGHWRDDAAGERQMTVLLCLHAPARGGSTRFRDLGEDVEARAGRLLVWNNLLADGTQNPHMIHSGVPVRKGNKSVLVTWIRQRAVRAVNATTT